MKITQLQVEGFRSLKNVIWNPGELNVVIGPNGSGKSNLLRLLEFISMLASANLGKYVQGQGGIDPLLWDGQTDSIFFSLVTSGFTGNNQKELTYNVKLSRVGRGGEYKIESELLGDYKNVKAGRAYEPFKHIDRRGVNARVFDENRKELVVPEASVSAQESVLAVAATPFINNSTIPEYQSALKSWKLYHDIDTTNGSVLRQPPVTRYETRVESNGSNLIPVLHTLYTNDRDFKRTINDAMRAAYGSDYDELIFPPAADQRVQMRVRWKTLRREQSTFELSDGTIRFLFLLTVLSSPDLAPLIAIDEPETGLHPSMLPIIAEHSVEASEKSQVVFTTHSAEFLNAFRGARPTVTVTKWEEGETKLTTISGQSLDYWLKDYSLGMLFRSGQLEEME
jgi:predicted ATPase